MARYRKIDPRIHNDAKFKALSERAKLLFLTILTHPHLTALGAMRATEAGLSEEMALGVSLKNTDCLADCPAGRPAGVFESYRRAFRNLIKKGLIKFDPANSCLVIPNFLKYNPPESPSAVMAWNQSGDLVPECHLRDELIENTRLFLRRYEKSSFLEAFKLVPNGGQTAGQTEGQTGPQTGGQIAGLQEQEQEQEFKNPPTPQTGGAGESDLEKNKKRSKEKANPVSSAYSSDFENFWGAYPNRRGGKEEAWKIWLRRAKAGTLPAAPELMAALDKLAKSETWQKEEGKYIPMITTFLNAGRWTDADALNPQTTPQNQIDPDCPLCHGRGTVDAEIDGVQGQADCQCRRGNHAS